MTVSFRKFVAAQALGIAALNAGINALYTWWLWRSQNPLTLFGLHGVGTDLATTPMVIAFLSTLLGTAAIRGKLADGRVSGPTTPAHALLGLAPEHVLLRSIVLAVACGALLSMPLLLGIVASGVDEVSLVQASLAKVAITVVMSLAIVPLVIHCALADVQMRRAAA